ncbi:MAG: hypothetical protein HYZ17_13830 [Betaproteobacteria bacterium]|nr:hypothetical protein [Betaproteobacteria bacterium]
MKSPIVTALALAAWMLPVVAAEPDGVFTCSYEIKKPCTQGSVSVEWIGGLVQKLTFENFFCGTAGRPGYSCTLESTRSGGEDRWRQQGSKTEIELGSPFNSEEKDTVLISVERDTFRFDFSSTQSGGKCGAGAQLPQSIALDRKSKKCSVRL